MYRGVKNQGQSGGVEMALLLLGVLPGLAGGSGAPPCVQRGAAAAGRRSTPQLSSCKACTQGGHQHKQQHGGSGGKQDQLEDSQTLANMLLHRTMETLKL